MHDKLSQIGTLTIAIGFLLLSFQNCGSSEMSSFDKATSNQNVNQDEIAKRYDELRKIAAADLSCAAVSDCEAVALGSKACGGPSGYLVASARNSSFDQILELAEDLAALESQYNIDNQVMSNCMFEMPPDLECAAAACKVK